MTLTSDATPKPILRFHLVDAGFVLLVCGLVAAVYGFTQDRIADGDGYPYDASSYMQMAKEVSGNRAIAAEKPFVYRIALPYLVGIFFPDRLLDGFRVLNLTFGAITLCILYAFLRRFTANNAVILAVSLVFVANPNGPFRFTYFSRAMTDTPPLLIMLSILYINTRWQRACWPKALTMSALSLLGVLFREIVLITPVALACAAFFACGTAKGEKREPCRYFIPLSIAPVAAGLVGLYLTHAWVQSPGEYTFFDHLLSSLNRNLRAPTIYFLSVFTSYGPL